MNIKTISASARSIALDRGYRALYSALLVGIILRIIWAAFIPVVPVSDSHAYDVFAINLAAGNGFGWNSGEPNGFFAPGIAFIYAMLYVVFGHSYGPVIALHILVSALSMALLWNLSKTWFGIRAANISAWLIALWPSQIMFVTILATELLFNFLILSAIWIWHRETLNIWVRSVLLGPLIAITALVRPHALLLPALLVFDRLVRVRQWGPTILGGAISALLMLLIIEPWALRNERIFGERFLVSANSGSNLWMGNNPQTSGAYMPVPDDVRQLNYAQRDKELKRRAIEYIIADPISFAQRSVIRLIKTHGYETINVGWNGIGIEYRFGKSMLMPLKLLSTAYWLVVLLAALIGLFLLFRRDSFIRAFSHPTVLLWAYFALIHAITVAQDRYHFISISMIAMLAGFAVASLPSINQQELKRAQEISH